MSRRAKGPRLWLNKRRNLWFVLDTGNVQRGTGCSAGDRERAERALQEYIEAKYDPGASVSTVRDPSRIPVADVINLYLRDIVPHRSRPAEITERLARVLEYFGDSKLDAVNGATCRAYVKSRSTAQAARRELEDLRAAINHHRKEGLHDRLVNVVLPARAARRERWMTRGEAARLILAAWRYRERQNARATDRATRKHVARFMVVARYMGSRAAVICGASIEDKRPPGRSWVDLNRGIFYGRPEGERETNKRKQTVAVPLPLVAHLRRWRARGQRYVVEWNGEPVKRISKAHRAACRDAGMPDVTPHVWRHSVATWLLEKGVRGDAVARWLAVSETVLRRVYGHLERGRFDDVHGAL